MTDCNDSSTDTGSLRYAIAHAADGDTIDMTGLNTSVPSCETGTIVLKNHDLVIAQENLTLDGPGKDNLLITGKYFDNGIHIQPFRVLTHTGTGSLFVTHLSIAQGKPNDAYGYANGGCISSQGTVQIIDAKVADCIAYAPTGDIKGGAIYSVGKTVLDHATVSNNKALIHDLGTAEGGGVYAADGLIMIDSTVTSSHAGYPATATDANSAGGGIYAKGSVYVRSSTISFNTSERSTGGLFARGDSQSVRIVDSTIANNTAYVGGVGGMSSLGTDTAIYNSTIAFNSSVASVAQGAGLYVAGTAINATLKLDSTIVSNNTDGGIANDLTTMNAALSGAKNLIYATNVVVPLGTLVGQCPLLGTLRNNGGPTDTLALLSRSPAIDAGNNVYPPNGLYNDQRGIPFARVVDGPDIGAYEVLKADRLFESGFDGCP